MYLSFDASYTLLLGVEVGCDYCVIGVGEDCCVMGVRLIDV